MNDCEKSRLLFRPLLDVKAVSKYIQEVFGVAVTDESCIKELNSYRDRNYFVRGNIADNGHSFATRGDGKGQIFNDSLKANQSAEVIGKFVFKVMSTETTYSKDFLDASIGVMEHIQESLGNSPYNFPIDILSRNGNFAELKELEVPLEYIAERDASFAEKIAKKQIEGDSVWKAVVGRNSEIKLVIKHYIRLLSFVDGKTMKDFEIEDKLLIQVGDLAATVCKALEGFSHPILIEKRDIWDLKNLLWLNSPQYLDAIMNKENHGMVVKCFQLFQDNFLSVAENLPKQTIHADINASNLITEIIDSKATIVGLIDFGEVTYSFRVCEIAICMAYMSLLRPNDCLKDVGLVLSGYLSKEPLTDLELKVLYYGVIGRLAQSLTMGNYQYSLDPGNEYLLTTSQTGWKVLGMFLEYEERVDELIEYWLQVHVNVQV
ncbi:hydroxylysine kinase-like [Rhopilema esculentum]|uniref:hydroxylysine kinase-like n=1 Tax=Rhopilema esculentum TaxID=499914 RepID=UPI0031D6CFE6|eukprot:gene12705-3422_t